MNEIVDENVDNLISLTQIIYDEYMNSPSET